MHFAFSKSCLTLKEIRWRSVIELGILLLVLNLVVFAQVVKFNFLIWDDEFYVLPHLMREGGLTPSSIHWALTNREAGWVAPLPYLTFFIDLEIYGLNPAGFHLTNLVIHALTTWLLFYFAVRTTAQLWPAFWLAVLFALHPLHIEPVVWVTCRWELLCGLFWMLGLIAYLRFCKTRSRLVYLAMCLAFVCSLLSKPMALTFPFVLVLLDFWPLNRLHGGSDSAGESVPGSSRVRACWSHLWAVTSAVIQSVREKWLLFLIMVVHLSLSLSVKTRFIAGKGQITFSFTDRLANSLETYAIYVTQFFWPASLSFYYPHPALQNTWVPGRYLLCGLLLLVISLFVFILIRRWPWLFVGWFWYLGVFVPAIGLVQVEEQARADRYTYLPLIGLSLAACWFGDFLFSRVRYDFIWRWVGTIVLLALIIPTARREASYWENSQTLMARGAEVAPRNFKAWFNLGHLAIRERKLDDAERYFRSALKVYDASRSNYLVGHVLIMKEQFAEAIPYLQAALRHNPNYSVAQVELAQALRGSGDEQAADREYEALATRFPYDPNALTHYAHFRLARGDHAEAIRTYKKVMQLAPTADRIGNFLGRALEASGDGAAALAFYDEYTARYPIRLDLADRAAWILATHPDERVRDGVEALRRAERLNAQTQFTNRRMLDTLAAACAESGDFARAVEVASQALQLAQAAGDVEHITAIQHRLANYRQRQPFHESKLTPVATATESPSETEP